MYSQEVADTICELIAEGKSLRSICRQEEMPGKSEVFRWLAENSAFRDQYARAREAQADHFFDEIIEVADDISLDPQSRRVMVDARKWAAGKLRPKVYGEKIETTHEVGESVTKIVREIVRA